MTTVICFGTVVLMTSDYPFGGIQSLGEYIKNNVCHSFRIRLVVKNSSEICERFFEFFNVKSHDYFRDLNISIQLREYLNNIGTSTN